MPDKILTNLTAGSALDGTELFYGIQGGNSRKFTASQLTASSADPTTDDGDTLGTASKRWSDLFLALGGVINWDNGDVTLTHSANTLTFGGASSGYVFDAVILPSANDGFALGSTATSFSDLFLASGAVINFANGDAAITHSSGVINVSTGTLQQGGSAVKIVGRETETIYASDWMPTITNGAGRSYEELATNDIISDTIDYDTTTQEFATAIWNPPKKYNGGTITFRVKCRLPSASAAQTVVLALSGAFVRNDDAVDATLGTAVTVTDTFIATTDLHVSPESAAVTLGGTYAAGAKVMLKLQRNVASDDATGDAKVEAVEIFWTSNAATDT